MRRVRVFIKGYPSRGKLLRVPNTYSAFISHLQTEFDIQVNKILLDNILEITDIDLIRDDDQIFLEPKKESSINDWLKFNVGGKIFLTTRATILSRAPDSLLSKISDHENGPVQSKHDESGAILIDRSPELFKHVLYYIRTGSLYDNQQLALLENLLDESKFFVIDSLTEILQKRIEILSSPSIVSQEEFTRMIFTTSALDTLRFRGLNFSQLNFSRMDLRNINFSFCVLIRCDFSHCNLSCCSFEHADMQSARLDGAILFNASFCHANLENASMEKVIAEDGSTQRANFEGARLVRANLSASHLSGVNLRLTNLKYGVLKNCILRETNFANSDLENCDFSASDLTGVNMRGAKLSQIKFDNIKTPLHISQYMHSSCD